MFNPQHLKAFRLQSGLTQAELAARLKVDRTTITRAELGERRIDLDLLQAWLEACGVTLSFDPHRGKDDLVVLAQQVIPQLSEGERHVLRALLEYWNVKNL